MKVQALFLREGDGLEKTVQQPAFTATDSAVQVKAGQGFRRCTQQRCRMLRHTVDHSLLAVAEGVALGERLMVKVVVDDSMAGVPAGRRRNGFAEQTAQRGPEYESRTDWR